MSQTNRISPLGTWLLHTLANHPDGLTLAELHGLALRPSYPHADKPTTVDIAGQLANLHVLERVHPGPWTYADGTPAPSGHGRCVRKWYADATVTAITPVLAKDPKP